MTGIRSNKVNGIRHFKLGDINVAMIGNLTEDAIKKYIQEQTEESEGAAFREAAMLQHRNTHLLGEQVINAL